MVYCFSAWGGSRLNALHSLEILKKRIIRALYGSIRFDHTEPLFKPLFNDLEMLRIKNMYTFMLNLFVFKSKHLQEYNLYTYQVISNYELRIDGSGMQTL